MEYLLDIILLSIAAANCVVHTFGVYLLVNLPATIQRVYIINLGVSEAMISITEVSKRIIRLAPFSNTTRKEALYEYFYILEFTGLVFVYASTTGCISADRLIHTLFRIEYRVRWNEIRARWLMIMVWSIGISLSIIVCLLYRVIGFNWENGFYKYFYPPFGFIIIILAIATYIILFRQHVVSCNMPAKRLTRNIKLTTAQIFRKSNFHIPILLITSFAIFTMTPCIVYLLIAVVGGRKTPELQAGCTISYATSFSADAFIYIYVDKEVLALMRRKMNIFTRGLAFDLERRPTERISLEKLNGSILGRTVTGDLENCPSEAITMESLIEADIEPIWSGKVHLDRQSTQSTQSQRKCP